MFFKKSVLKKFTNFTEKYQCWSQSLFNGFYKNHRTPINRPPTHRPTDHLPLTHRLTDRLLLTYIEIEDQTAKIYLLYSLI